MLSCSLPRLTLTSRSSSTFLRHAQHRYRRDGHHRNNNNGNSGKELIKASKKKDEEKHVNQLFKPVVVLPNQDDINLGEEIAGKISKQSLLRQLNTFYVRKETKELAREQGLDDYLYHQVREKRHN